MLPSFPLSNRAVIAGLVAVALLFAQWAGLTHSIVHAGWQQAQLQAAPSTATASLDGKSGKDLHHSCPAFDAATIPAAIHSTPFIAPVLPSAHVLALWAAFASWDAPLICNFLSRAPPSL
jgi:hypothetical protein